MNEGAKMAAKSPSEMDKIISGIRTANEDYQKNLDWMVRICKRLINEPSGDPIPPKREKESNSGHLSSFVECTNDYNYFNKMFATILERLENIV
jgi:hypothetical protein